MPAAAAPSRILIVDDDVGLLRLIGKALQREQLITATAASGRAALDWLREQTADLLLLDLKLPDFGAKELMQEAANLGRAIPFIVITGQGDERVAVEMMKSGALDYLVKDNHFLEFLPAVVKRTLVQLEKDKRLVIAEARALELQRQILEATECEQRRIGRDLHDGLGQNLTALELLSQLLIAKLKTAAPELVVTAQEISRQIRETIKQTRLLSHNLSPIPLEEDGLMLALSELADGTQAMTGIKCGFDCPKPVRLADANAATHIYRIAQEAVNNALKYSGSKEIEITLADRNGRWFMAVADHGRGLPDGTAQKPGIGLHMMKYRANMIGAALEIESEPQKGVRVSCTLRKAR